MMTFIYAKRGEGRVGTTPACGILFQPIRNFLHLEGLRHA
jgi:hypothetical protein